MIVSAVWVILAILGNVLRYLTNVDLEHLEYLLISYEINIIGFRKNYLSVIEF